MLIRNLKVVVYDIEIFPNCFTCTYKDTTTDEINTFEISNRKNQLAELVDFFMSKDIMFCGYNNHYYDDVVINYIIDLYNIISKKSYRRL